MWIILVLIYGLLKGAREVCKKKSLEKNTVIEVLFFYTLFSFILVLPNIANIESISIKLLCLIALKSFIIFLAWILSFHAIHAMPVSLYGILDLSRVLFAGRSIPYNFYEPAINIATMFGFVKNKNTRRMSIFIFLRKIFLYIPFCYY